MLSEFSVMAPQIHSIVERFNQEYLNRYLQNRLENREQKSAWRPIVAAVHFLDNIPELADWLLEQIRIGLTLEEMGN